MSISNGYATLAEFQNLVGREESASDLNADQIEIAIESASRFIDAFTNTFFFSQTFTDTVIDRFQGVNDDGLVLNDNGDTIYTPAPIISVASVSEDSVALVENTDFYVYKKAGKIDREGLWSLSRLAVTMTLTCGYATVPDHIRTICITIASIISGLDVKTVVDYDGNEQTFITKNLPKWVISALERERRVVI